MARNRKKTRSSCGIGDKYDIGKYHTTECFERGKANDVRQIFNPRVEFEDANPFFS